MIKLVIDAIAPQLIIKAAIAIIGICYAKHGVIYFRIHAKKVFLSLHSIHAKLTESFNWKRYKAGVLGVDKMT